jgi:hypothetical protein
VWDLVLLHTVNMAGMLRSVGVSVESCWGSFLFKLSCRLCSFCFFGVAIS